MNKNKIKLGIIGTGRIANRVVTIMKKNTNLDVVSVYNPYTESAVDFANKLDIKKIALSIDELIDASDAVYIASPNETHYKYSKKLLENGIHVLCEKPMVFKKGDAVELFDIAKNNKVTLMEGLKTAYLPGFNALISMVEEGEIGEVVDVNCSFTRLTEKNKRERTDKNYGGSFTEFGSYGLLVIDKIYGDKIEDIKFSCRMDEDESFNMIDLYTKAEFKTYESKAFATIRTGLAYKTQGDLVITGSLGYFYVPAPWWLTTRIERHYEDPNKVDVYEYPFEKDVFMYEIQEFISRIRGDKERYFLDRDSIFISSCMEKFFNIVGRFK